MKTNVLFLLCLISTSMAGTWTATLTDERLDLESHTYCPSTMEDFLLYDVMT